MAGADRVPFVPGRAMVVVRATINNGVNGVDDFLLLVDSGARRMLVSQRAAAYLNVDLAHPLRSEPLVGVGRSPAVPAIRLDRVQVGASVATGLEASVYDLPAFLAVDGLLGLNFPRRFRVTFEFDTRSLVLRPPPPRPPRRTP